LLHQLFGPKQLDVISWFGGVLKHWGNDLGSSCRMFSPRACTDRSHLAYIDRVVQERCRTSIRPCNLSKGLRKKDRLLFELRRFAFCLVSFHGSGPDHLRPFLSRNILIFCDLSLNNNTYYAALHCSNLASTCTMAVATADEFLPSPRVSVIPSVVGARIAADTSSIKANRDVSLYRCSQIPRRASQ
jgi:hypothetical protein